MGKRKKNFSPILVISVIVFFLLVVGIYFATANKNSSTSSNNSLPQPSPATTSSFTDHEATKEVKIFADEKYGFTFKYPGKYCAGTSYSYMVVVEPYCGPGGGNAPLLTVDKLKKESWGYKGSLNFFLVDHYDEMVKLPIGGVINDPDGGTEGEVAYKRLGNIVVSEISALRFEGTTEYSTQRSIFVRRGDDLYLIHGSMQEYDYNTGKQIQIG